MPPVSNVFHSNPQVQTICLPCEATSRRAGSVCASAGFVPVSLTVAVRKNRGSVS